MVGLFEPDAAAWAVPGVPDTFSFGEIEPDWERISPFLEAAMGRVPRCLEAQLAQEAVHPARRHRPPAPAWCLRGPRPLLRTPERTLSIMEARRGCSSPPQAAPKLRILSAFYLQEVGAKKLFCGPESFTPDLSPIVGEVRRAAPRRAAFARGLRALLAYLAAPLLDCPVAQLRLAAHAL